MLGERWRRGELLGCLACLSSHPSSLPPLPLYKLATGRHVKFLRMGTAWAVAMHPWAFPFAHFLATTLYLPGLRGGGGGKKGIQLLPPDAEGGAVVGRGERNGTCVPLLTTAAVQDPNLPFMFAYLPVPPSVPPSSLGS